jgi:uncharacterized membrane protein
VGAEPDGEVVSAAASRRGEVARVCAFTDGVFAIVITILVLDVKVPDLGSNESLRASVEEAQPTVVAWVISFLITGMYWAMHRGLFAQVRFADTQVVWLNLLFLLPVCLVPYAASAMGGYPDDPLALHLFGVILIATTIGRLTMVAYLDRRPELLWETPTQQTRLLLLLTAAFPLVVYAAAMLVATVSPFWSRFLFLSVPGLYLVLVAGLRLDRRTRVAAEDLS